MSSLGDLCSEQAELNHILREEQQLYTKLVHAVKEQDRWYNRWYRAHSAYFY